VQLEETAVIENDGDSVNMLLAIESFCQALQFEMLTYLRLKKGDSNEAWNYVIEAQGWVIKREREAS
jgi:hypothetical protein